MDVPGAFEDIAYAWRDEREGLWSDVAVDPGRITITPRATYRRSKWLAAGIASVAWAWVGVSYVTKGNLNFALLLAPIVTWMAVQSFKAPRRPILVTSADVDSRDETNVDQARVVKYTDVSAVILRENSGRRADDSALAQIYLLIAGQGPTVIHQEHLNKYDQVRETGLRIAAEIGVATVDYLPTDLRSKD